MTQRLFKDWFLNYFVPQVRGYFLERSIPFVILLLLDSAPGHPSHLSDHPDVEVLFCFFAVEHDSIHQVNGSRFDCYTQGRPQAD